MLAKVGIRYKNVFERLGRRVGRNPWHVVMFVGFVELALGMALFWSTATFTELSENYVPRESQAVKDEKRLRDLGYGRMRSSTENVSATLNLFPDELVEAELIIQDTSGNKTLTTVTGQLQWIKNCVSMSRNDVEFLPGNATLTFPIDSFYYYGHLFADTYTSENMGYKANYYKIIWRFDKAYMYWSTLSNWEVSYRIHQRVTACMTSQPGLRFADYSPAWRDHEMDSDFTSSLYVVVLTVAAIWIVNTLTLWSRNNNNVSQSLLLLVVSLVSTVLATLAGFSVISIFRLYLTFGILGYLPVITLLQSILHIQMQVATFGNINHELSPEEKVATLLRKSSVGWGLASVAQLIVLSIGIASSMKAVQEFFLFAVCIFLFTLINEMTFVPACFAIHDRRVRAAWHFCCCNPVSKLPKQQIKRSKFTQKIHSLFCEGQLPETRSDTFGYCDYVIEVLITKLTSLATKFKSAIFVVYVICLGVLAVSALFLLLFAQNDREPKLVSADSQLRHFYEWDARFSHSTAISFVIDKQMNYSLGATKGSISKLISDAQKDPNVVNGLAINWIEDQTWRSGHDYDNILCVPTCDLNSRVISSRFIVFAHGLTGPRSKAGLMSRMRKLADNSDLNIFAYSIHFALYEQYDALIEILIEMICVPIACLIPLCLLCFHCRFVSVASVVTLTTASTVYILGLWSLFSLLPMALNFQSIFPMVFAVVLSNSSTVWAMSAFFDSDSPLDDDTLNSTTINIFVPNVKTSICSMIGLLCMASFPSYICYTLFRSFMVAFGVIGLHNGVILPVWCGAILSLRGTIFSELLGNNRVGALPENDIHLNNIQY